MSDHVYLTSTISHDTIQFDSTQCPTIHILSKIEDQVSTNTRRSVFGIAKFGSIFGITIQYGSNLFNSKMVDKMELTSGIQDTVVQLDSTMYSVVNFVSEITTSIQLTSQLIEV